MLEMCINISCCVTLKTNNKDKQKQKPKKEMVYTEYLTVIFGHIEEAIIAL
jgi:hypothetical protein